jgi:quercetin dioxygenase-like cupin family protein
VKILRFDPEVGRPIDLYGSSFIQSRIVHTTKPTHISCMYLGPSGLVGYHQATVPQLFLVVQGAGWVRGEGPERRAITAGQAVFWEAGEWHETGTDTGLVAIVIEGEALAPGQFLREARE